MRRHRPVPRERPATASLYGGTTAAVDWITRSLATELGPKKIRAAEAHRPAE